MVPPRKLLTIGGSDSGGAAGIQADLKTWAALGAYGMSALTAVTAQNSVRVAQALFLPPELVAAQIEAVLSDYGADGIKTGLIGRYDLIESIFEQLLTHAPHTPLVVDPVLVNHRREALFGEEVAAGYREWLLPLATLITPNWAEAALLANRPISAPADLEAAAEVLVAGGCRAVLVTGWESADVMADLFHDGTAAHWLTAPRIATTNTHGSGDTLSAAIVARLVAGDALPAAIESARRFTHRALLAARSWHPGAGHGPLWHHQL
jgi:hydroxymethylpyrimidine kinase/phosphomethylpyrimidine kinase